MATGEATTEAPSLQSRFDQIGVQVDKAHEALDRICVDGVDDKATVEPTIEGAEAAASHCQRGLMRLLERLENVANRVGHL
jgi:hypothetical protein